MIQFRRNGMQDGVRLKHFLLCIAGWLAGGLAPPAFAGTNSLTRVGPYGGGVYKVAFHPIDSSIVYATTTAGFYRSTDGGQSWEMVNDSIPNVARDVAVHASQPNRVFVVTSAPGVLASEDAGATLSVLGSSTGFQPSGTDVEYSADASVLYVSTGRQVYRSTDHGNTWLRGGDIPITAYMASSLVVDPADPNRLYMVGDAAEGFQSADAGMTWQSWSVPNSTIHDLAIANTQPSPRIWAATSNSIRFSDDRGVSWTIALTTNAQTVTVDPNDPTIIYAGTYEGLLRTRDNGAHWSNIQGDASTGTIESIAIDPADSNHLLLTGQAGVASSSDGGTHWTSRNTGIDALSSYELVSSPASDRIYINAFSDGVYAISPEDGTTPPLNNRQLRQLTGHLGFQGLGLAVLPGAPDRLFIGAGANVARSLDGGESWSLHGVSPSQGLHRVVIASADGSKLLATTGSRLYSTSDGGNTWTQDPTMGANDLHVMASAPSNPQVIYLAGRQPGATRDVILRSADSGATWTTHNFPGTDVLAIAVDPSNEQTLYTGGTLGELFKSTNGGQTWASVTIPGPYAQRGGPFWALAIDPRNPNILYAGGGSFIARSVDAGASWQQLSYDADRFLDIRSLLVDPIRPHSLYVAISGKGVREFSVAPDLRITATVPDFPTAYGAVATYSYRISNAGPFDATNVRARIQLPPNAANITAVSPGASCTIAGAIVTCTASILRTGAGADITITSTQPAAGNIAVVGTVEGDQVDASPEDNSVTSDVSIVEMADLSVSLSGPVSVTRGEAINLSMTVRNAGPNDATAAAISFELATGLSVASVTPSAGTCSTTGNTVFCELPSLAAGRSASIMIVSAATNAAGLFSSIATVNASGLDLQMSNDYTSYVTRVNEPAQSGGGSSGGGGGSSSLLMLAALLLLSRMRAAAAARPRR